MNLADIGSAIAESQVEFVRFEQSDTHGIARSKLIPASHVARFAEDGLNFLLGQLGFDAQAGVAPGTGYLEELGFPDRGAVRVPMKCVISSLHTSHISSYPCHRFVTKSFLTTASCNRRRVL
jgi:hypothetical protein